MTAVVGIRSSIQCHLITLFLISQLVTRNCHVTGRQFNTRPDDNDQNLGNELRDAVFLFEPSDYSGDHGSPWDPDIDFFEEKFNYDAYWARQKAILMSGPQRKQDMIWSSKTRPERPEGAKELGPSKRPGQGPRSELREPKKGTRKGPREGTKEGPRAGPSFGHPRAKRSLSTFYHPPNQPHDDHQFDRHANEDDVGIHYHSHDGNSSALLDLPPEASASPFLGDITPKRQLFVRSEQRMILAVRYEADPEPDIIWTLNKKEIEEDDKDVELLNDDGNNTSAIKVPKMKPELYGFYKVRKYFYCFSYKRIEKAFGL